MVEVGFENPQNRGFSLVQILEIYDCQTCIFHTFIEIENLFSELLIAKHDLNLLTHDVGCGLCGPGEVEVT